MVTNPKEIFSFNEMYLELQNIEQKNTNININFVQDINGEIK